MTQNKKRIAITGGIGSGKSAAAAIIKEAGYPVFSADEEYASLLSDAGFVKKLDEEFSVAPGGILDKKKLSSIVFSDREKLARLNQLSHPLVMERLLSKMTAPLSFAEVPLLFEGRFSALFDGVIVITRDKAQRIASVMQRSRLSEEEVLSRMKNQIDYESYDLSAHTVIKNDGTLEAFRQKVLCAIQSM
ncbi:MAG: dephospho-CoA kinase [Christensenellaceae bacterium]